MSFLRRALTSVNATILSSKQSLGIPLKLEPKKDIFLFNAKDSVREWTASSDRSIGGLSECKWGFYGPSTDGSSGADSKEDTGADPKGIITNVNKEDNIPSAVFTGRLSTVCQPTEAGIVRSGYCAVRASIPRGLLLHGYEGISMRVMTDGREYRLNAQMESWNPLNIYMGFIQTPANEWVDIELPFSDFLLTAKGYVKLDDETELDPAKLLNLGFAIADQKEGDFELRVQWIKALAQIDRPDNDKGSHFDDDDNFGSSKPEKDTFRKAPDLAI